MSDTSNRSFDFRQNFFRPGDALLDCRAAANKRSGNLAYAETTQDVEDKRHLRLLRQARMAAREHHAKLVVPDGMSREEFLERRRTSSARCLAVAMSQADGFPGTPRNFHTSRARQKASWVTSSASARLWTPNIRVKVAIMRPASRRKR